MSIVTKTPEYLPDFNYQFIKDPTSGPWNQANNREEPIWNRFAAEPEAVEQQPRSEENDDPAVSRHRKETGLEVACHRGPTRQMTSAMAKAAWPYCLDITNSFMEADRGIRPRWVEWCDPPEQLIKTFRGGDKDVFPVDLAGGRSHDRKTFRAKLPSVEERFILEGLQHVLEQRADGLQAEKVALDLFKEQFKGAHVYYIKSLLHDWSDTQCHQIFIASASPCAPGQGLLSSNPSSRRRTTRCSLSATWDWEMMVFSNSLERSEIYSTGFQTRSIILLVTDR
ncbi:hypothetical protein BDW75DRAFT_242699 [Aspergillus navahoensis]